ncbi:unnamed protein product [Caenorhabditis bovis]|uniref:Glycosyltransferase family 92 protein n=1 Tax=Caenorhabditis bovis TaxID=2654633 RepID=A0A8S1ERJ6_9PELO|nr:unnamed protein product [Caenorhabditis bovis]
MFLLLFLLISFGSPYRLRGELYDYDDFFNFYNEFKNISEPSLFNSKKERAWWHYDETLVSVNDHRNTTRIEFVKEMARVLKAQSSDLQVWQRAHSEFFASIDSKEKFFTEVPNIFGGYYSIYKIIHGGGCTETGIPDPSHITTNHSVTILSTPGSGPEFAKELVKNIPFPLASQQFQFYDNNFVKQGIFRGTVCDVEGAFIDHNQLREYMSRFWIRWRRNNENGTFQELVNTPIWTDMGLLETTPTF